MRRYKYVISSKIFQVEILTLMKSRSSAFALYLFASLVINIGTLSKQAHSQVFVIEQSFNETMLEKIELLKRITHNEPKGIRQLSIGEFFFFYIDRVDTCGNEGCMTVIARNIDQEIIAVSAISNGKFHVSDNYISKYGRGPLFILYQNGQRTIELKFVKNYFVIQ